MKEDVFFGNPQYFDVGNQVSLQPTLIYLSYADQQSTPPPLGLTAYRL